MLTERWDAATLADALLPSDQWQDFPSATDRQAWNTKAAEPFGRSAATYLAGYAAAQQGQPWPELRAARYADYIREGDRSRYEKQYFERRLRLGRLAVAYCFQPREALLADIVDGIWHILGEPSWCVPAHARRGDHQVAGEPDPLIAPQPQSVDLFAAQTAAVLGETVGLLGDALAAASPNLLAWIRQEVARRVLVPVRTEEQGWFNGFNNWTPWCASSCLLASAHLEDDATFRQTVLRLLPPLDRFLDRYGDDGGCDEGPNYWGKAAGALLDCLELLYSRSAGRLNVYDEPKIAEMGRFITRTHLDGPWFVNFADAGARVSPDVATVWRYGERIDDPELQNLALLSLHQWDPRGEARATPPAHLMNLLRWLWWVPANQRPHQPARSRHSWLPDLQVLVARQSATPGEGLVLAAKGGHNAESHNHNDIGHFILWLDGQPGIVDVGVETYTRQTFGPRRYDLWCIRASAHNAPVFGEFEQAPGEEHWASDVTCTEDGEQVTLSLDLAAAYPAEAGIESLRRDLRFDRAAGEVTVRDELAATAAQSVVLTFYSLARPELGRDGWRLPCGERALVTAFPAATFAAEVGEVPLADARLRSSWGDRLWRVRLTSHQPLARGAWELRFTVG